MTAVELAPPADDSVEAALPPDRLGWLDLRGFRGLPGGPTSMRVLDTQLPGPVAEANRSMEVMDMIMCYERSLIFSS